MGKLTTADLVSVETATSDKRLLKIREMYDDKELDAIARGGRLIPGKAKIPIIDFDGEKIKIGLFGDTHIGSIYFDETMYFRAIEEFEKEKCDIVLHTGDITEGMSNRPGHIYELDDLGYTAQKDHAIRLLNDIHTDFYTVSGNHDRWFIKSNGADILADIAENVPKMHYLGHDEGNLSLGGRADIKIWHGEDGSSYAHSYRIQKVVEAFTGGEKPSILVLGHVHKSIYVYERHIHCISAGCIQRQSKWMRGKRLPAHTGFWILEATINKNGVAKLQNTWYPFYN